MTFCTNRGLPRPKKNNQQVPATIAPTARKVSFGANWGHYHSNDACQGRVLFWIFNVFFSGLRFFDGPMVNTVGLRARRKNVRTSHVAPWDFKRRSGWK